MKLSELAHVIGSHQLVGMKDPDVQSIEMDNRRVKPGALFVCIKGERFDGHDFAEDAVSKGAVALVAERQLPIAVPMIIVSDARRALPMIADHFYGHPTSSLSLIGVTGTKGKTTVTHLIRAIQEEAGIPTGLVGTLGIHYKDHHEKVNNTTPESLDLQRSFRNMVDCQVPSAVMEVSSHALVQGRVRGLDFNIAVFTNLTHDHLDYHGTMENYLYAKSLLFSQLGNTYGTDRLKAAVLNQDDEATAVLKKMTAVPVWTFGIDQSADFTADHIEMTATGTRFTLKTPVGTHPVETKLVGKFNVYNILAACTACFVNGINIEAILRAIEKMEGVSGRFETVRSGQNFTVIVDYSHTPDSLKNALIAIREVASGRVITVVGCGGDRDRLKRPIMAKAAVDLSDVAIFTSDNPRTEDPDSIIEDMKAGVSDGSYEAITDRRQAIERAIGMACPNDVVLIAGKGHETYQIIGEKVIDFDDREVARNAIKERQNHGR
ncbi:UDP-N-acetylmuramoyl-L-alanyl-D-glutamate--2,6-diaminopimelate ligase [Camelliibacillus cellulosilyticus]|uniref:UDP-N-acetylmuramoyl-L-alanyl-D-glutamate--2,6-diaminopimelate ligase n=1 Tax=Camelliibacillus cellulosilyticus TaxID=2174486 RepID=A0ABV9GJH2_9BACL